MSLTNYSIYLAELFSRFSYPPERAIASDDYDRKYNIYVFRAIKASDYETTYWSDWGGNYDDLPDTTDLQILMGSFLKQVESTTILEETPNSFMVNGDFVFMNLTKKPWQYKTTETEVERLEGHCSAPPDTNNPSNVLYGGVKYNPRLMIPSISNKLGDTFSGLALYSSFSIDLYNHDGMFDDFGFNNFFNTPARILKSNTKNPERSDFNIIGYGLVKNQSTTFTKFSIKTYDIWDSLDEETCRVFNTTDFPSCPDSTLDKDIPKLWGSKDKVPLFSIDGSTGYYAADYVTAVSAVYDSDGNSLSFTFNSSTGVITESTGEADSADCTGSSDNRLGEILRDEIADMSGILYNDENWDTAEADTYINSSPELNFYYEGGKVNDLIEDLILNDNVFFIQKVDSLLTLRKYGNTYQTHDFKTWTITQKPTKSHSNAVSNYLTSVKISYNKNLETDDYDSSYIDDTQADTIFEKYRKYKRLTFETDLANYADVTSFATDLLDRFGALPEIIEVGIGEDTSNVNLLDYVNLPFSINGRRFTDKIGFYVIGINPAQDKLTLESGPYYEIFRQGYAVFDADSDLLSMALDTGFASFDYASGDYAAEVTQQILVETNPEFQAVASFDYAAEVTQQIKIEQDR